MGPDGCFRGVVVQGSDWISLKSCSRHFSRNHAIPTTELIGGEGKLLKLEYNCFPVYICKRFVSEFPGAHLPVKTPKFVHPATTVDMQVCAPTQTRSHDKSKLSQICNIRCNDNLRATEQILLRV